MGGSRLSITLGEMQRLLLLSILIGIFAGLLVVCFHVAMDFITWVTLERTGGFSYWRTILWPMVGGVGAFLLTARVFRAARGSGVNDTKAAVYVSEGFVPFSVVAGKFIACGLSIGTGNSMGPEDPALHMGAGVASLLGRVFRLSRERMRLIAPVGAAAGLAAAFNTPISAVLFVIEEVLANWSAAVLGSIVLSAVSAVVVLRWFLGNQPLFLVPEFQFTSATELLVYVLIGICGGLMSALFVRLVRVLRERLKRLPERLSFVPPLGAGLMVGLAGIWLPQVMGAGYSGIGSALHDRFPWYILIALGVVKMMATLFCFSAGTPGGMFAPTLFTGAMIGGGIGALARIYWPSLTSSTSAYVLVGMGTFFAGVFRAPMTSIFMVFEVSASYVIILPAMIANTIAYLVSRRLQRTPFFTMVAREEGLELPSAEEQREAQVLRVEDAMSPAPARVLKAHMPIRQASQILARDGVTLVDRGSGTWAEVKRAEVEGALQSGDGDSPLEDVLPLHDMPRLYPDVSLDTALRMLGSYPLLPVSSRAAPHRLLGVLTLEDVYRVYQIPWPEKKVSGQA